MVCGSIGYGGAEEIMKFYSFLRKEGFDTLDHISDKKMNYSDVADFRRKKALSRRIVRHDLSYVAKSDVLVVISNGPSYGTGIEMYVGKRAGKIVVLLAPGKIPTPWPVNFADYVTSSKEELVVLLHRLSARRAC